VDGGVELRTVTGRPIAAVRRTTTWREFPKVWRPMLDEVYAFLNTNNVRPRGRNVMLYRDDVPNVEVGVEIDSPFVPDRSVVASALPSGRVATSTHRGPYDGLGATHRAIIEWCAANGHERAGPRWEIYGDWHEDPALLETEVHYLLR
jgi:effector-binding domain-containing protein